MSIECLNQALKIQFEGQTPTKRLILILLANYCDDNKSCYPSYKHIAKLAGLKDPKHIAKIIHEFKELGLLRIEHRHNESGGVTSNRYHLTLEAYNNPPMGLETPTPTGEETPTLRVQTPPNTKDNTKDLDTAAFDCFWDFYPRKVGKVAARKIFTKKCQSLSKGDVTRTMVHKLIIGAAHFFAIEQKRTEEKFIPHAQTWLNQERFMDYKKIVAQAEQQGGIERRSLNSIAG